tara:strand:- start:1019 stop:2410 length:1392 start_codon:yes stop_codon:yes gene_type:complete
MLFVVITWAQHFVPVWLEYTDDPFNPHTFLVFSAIMNGSDLESGDEIGIFDGDDCVGASILEEEISAENFLEIVSSEIVDEIPGFTIGNEISYRFWDSSEQTEIGDVSSNYFQGDEIFTFLGSSFIGLSGEGSCLDFDLDGVCDIDDLDDDNDGIVDSEDCAPLYELASEVDCCGVCGGDNSSCGNCCGMPFGDDCSSVCEIDEMGVCCMIDEMDECGICFGDNSFCFNCEPPFIDVDGHCLHQGDIDALQDLIDNSMNSGYDFGCQYPNDPYCASPNLTMDQVGNWHWVVINGESFEFANDSGVVDPLELGLQEWTDGRLTSLMCGAYIYCQLSGELPGSLSNLTEIEVLRLEVNYFTGYVPESICELENINFDDYLSFDLSYNELCPPYPDCISENSVQYMEVSNCLNGDVNQDGFINIMDIVQIIDAILNNIEIQGADVNEDGFINVIDVVTLVSAILNG